MCQILLLTALPVNPNSAGRGQNSPLLLDSDLGDKKAQAHPADDRIPCAACSDVLLYKCLVCS